MSFKETSDSKALLKSSSVVFVRFLQLWNHDEVLFLLENLPTKAKVYAPQGDESFQCFTKALESNVCYFIAPMKELRKSHYWVDRPRKFEYDAF